MLGRFGRLRREEFELDDSRYARVGTEVERWRALVLEFDIRPKLEPEIGPEL